MSFLRPAAVCRPVRHWEDQAGLWLGHVQWDWGSAEQAARSLMSLGDTAGLGCCVTDVRGSQGKDEKPGPVSRPGGACRPLGPSAWARSWGGQASNSRVPCTPCDVCQAWTAVRCFLEASFLGAWAFIWKVITQLP